MNENSTLFYVINEFNTANNLIISDNFFEIDFENSVLGDILQSLEFEPPDYLVKSIMSAIH